MSNDLKKYRNEIDELDETIFSALNKRIEISKEIGKYKNENNIDTIDNSRENDILKKTYQYDNYLEIQKIYQEIFKVSKEKQKFDYFLVGEKIPYSLSPYIYKELGLFDYNVVESDDFQKVLKGKYLGINVTIPYKYEAYNSVDILSDFAKTTKVVNCIVRKDNLLYGYNTDYIGFLEELKYFNVEMFNKKVLIIGNGCTSRTITEVVKSLGSSNIKYLVREIRNENEYLISEYDNFNEYQIIINTTPYGTSPNYQENPLFTLENFMNLEYVIDVVYNPLKSPLLKEAQKYKIKTINGLFMLISQAIHNKGIFGKGIQIDASYAYEKIYKNLMNIIIIGMPFVGKTTIGKNLSHKINKKFVDTDAILSSENHSLKEVLVNGSIDDYRLLEEQVVIRVSKNLRQVISTGGGVVLNEKSMRYLKQNGIVIYLKDENLKKLYLRNDGNRPLISTFKDYNRLYCERKYLYEKYADIIINSNEVNNIEEKINEYFSNQWS